MTSHGLFITFEGGEGVGKTTQINLLRAKIEKLEKQVVVSREPGGTPGAEAIRNVLLDKSAVESFGPKMEALLFAASRNDHVEQIIKPALEEGHVVIIDRFMDSTRVYQGISGKLEEDFMASLERVAINDIVPDLTIILDLDPEIGLARANERRNSATSADRYEKENLAIHQARRKAFQAIAAAEPLRCRLIAADGAPDEIHAMIWPHVENAMEQKGMSNASTSTKKVRT